MYSSDGQPIRIVVETVPHDVVKRLEEADNQLKNRLQGVNNQLFQCMEIIGELRRELVKMQQNCAHCESVYNASSPLRRRRN